MTSKPAAPAAANGRRRPVPRTADISTVDLDILGDLLSFYIRVLNLVVSRDLDAAMRGTPVARGTGKISTLLLVAANPGIRPSVIAHFNMKDRSAMMRILADLRRAGLIEQRVSDRERRAHELDPLPEREQVPGSLVSPMPGTVVRVEAVVGARVATGTPLVALEAMKMEHSLRAPHDGTVAEVRVAVGDQVDTGTVLVVVLDEAAEDEPA